MNLEAEIVSALAKEMAASMDFEILVDVLCRFGWTRLDIKYSAEKTWQEVIDWVDQTCQTGHKEHNGIWIFEDPKDAAWFKLRWVS